MDAVLILSAIFLAWGSSGNADPVQTGSGRNDMQLGNRHSASTPNGKWIIPLPFTDGSVPVMDLDRKRQIEEFRRVSNQYANSAKEMFIDKFRFRDTFRFLNHLITYIFYPQPILYHL